jgi:hypothetical protein
MFNYCRELTINPNWIINEETKTDEMFIISAKKKGKIGMFDMSPLKETVLEKTHDCYNRIKTNKDIINTIQVL